MGEIRGHVTMGHVLLRRFGRENGEEKKARFSCKVWSLLEILRNTKDI